MALEKMLLAIFSLFFTAGVASAEYTFLSIGDWGGAFVGETNPAEVQYKNNVYAVAQQMAITANQTGAKFIINTGDNFYWCGIQNTSDPQIKADFEDPYSDPALQVRWYGSLGVSNNFQLPSNSKFNQMHFPQNHEYGYNVDAQIQYTKLSNSWFIPERYYTQRIHMDGSHYLSLIVLDTSPCVQDYRSNDVNLWDPCFTKYPTCSVMNTDDDFEGPCKFHENILSQNCMAQYNWLQSTLMGIPRDDWLVVVGHHPIDEVDVKDFTSLLQQRGFSLYLNGHTHLMNQYTLDGAGAYVTTGAGSMVNTADQQHPKTLLKTQGKAVPTATYGHSYQSICTNVVAGFTAHSFNSDFTELTTTFYNNLGGIVNQFTSDKNGVWTAAPGACVN